MKKSLLQALILLFAIVLAGCATVPNTSLDRSTAGEIKSVTLLKVNESKRFLVRDLSGLPALGGAIGGLIAGSVQDARAQDFVKGYNEGNIKLSQAMVESLQQDLAKNGLEITYNPDEVAKLKDGKDDYSHISVPTDTILNVWFGSVGYIAKGAISADYEPWVMTTARLINSKTKQVLFQKTYTAGYKAKIENAIFVPCGTTYRFATFKVLMEQLPSAIQGLSECQQSISQQIVADLK